MVFDFQTRAYFCKIDAATNWKILSRQFSDAVSVYKSGYFCKIDAVNWIIFSKNFSHGVWLSNMSLLLQNWSCKLKDFK